MEVVDVRKNYLLHFKRRVIECLNDSNVSETVREYNTSQKNVTRWKGQKVNIMHNMPFKVPGN